jgi:hypothetical protein
MQRQVNVFHRGNGGKRKLYLNAQKPETESGEMLDSKRQNELNEALLTAARIAKFKWQGLNGAEEVLRLIRLGADVNAKNKWGGTALMGFASVGDTRICMLLLENGADLEARTRYDGTALNWAKNSNPDMHDETVALLVAVSALDKIIGTSKRPAFLSDLRKCAS